MNEGTIFVTGISVMIIIIIGVIYFIPPVGFPSMPKTCYDTYLFEDNTTDQCMFRSCQSGACTIKGCKSDVEYYGAVNVRKIGECKNE